jgi:mannose-1-phosphate guanylyltransferase
MPLINFKEKQFMINVTGLDDRLLRGLVLAGGEGRRLQSYVQQLRGEELPKQYVNFIGRRSMLEHTFHRVEQLIPAGRILTVVSRPHLAHAEVRRQLAARPRETLIVQPVNKETAPGILLPLMFIYKAVLRRSLRFFPQIILSWKKIAS